MQTVTVLACNNRLTWVLYLHCGVRLRVRFVNYLRAHLLCENLFMTRSVEMNHLFCLLYCIWP